jgi:polar amino acid transport system substrate-binding protein
MRGLTRSRFFRLALVSGLGALVFGALVASSPSNAVRVPPHKKPAPLAHLLPSSVKPGSTLTVPSSIEYAPFEYFAANGTTAIGLDVDIMNAIGQLLGIKFKFENYSFAAIIPAVQDGRFLISQSSFSDTSAREKQVSFVDYFIDGEQIMVKAGNPDHINSFLDLCGRPVALAVGDTDIGVAADTTKQCKAAKKPAVNGQILPGTPADLLAISSGRSEATIIDSAAGGYDVRTTKGKYEMVGPIIDSGPYGIVLRKSETKFISAIQAALVMMKSQGTYQRILAKWAESDGAIKSFTINAAAKYGV